MSFTYSDAPASCQLPGRNARSFDLDDSVTKAAAWVWHLHTANPGITTEGRFISSQTKRRNSGSYDRKVSRFQQEASTTMRKETVRAHGPQPMWDCGSNLYDTFELVAFGNSLDRSLMEAVPITPSQAQPQEHPKGKHLLKVPANGIPRAKSLPRSLSSQKKSKASAMISSAMDMDKLELAKSCNNGSGTARIRPEKASTKGSTVAKFVSAMKKAVILRTQAFDVGCKRSTNVMESSQIRPIIRDKKNSESAIERELTLNPKVIGPLSAANCRDVGGTNNRLSTDSRSFRYDYVSDSRSNYKLSIPIANEKLNYGRNGSSQAAMPRRIRAVSTDTLNGGYFSANQKIRSKSESFSGERNETIRSTGRRKHAEDGGNGSINDRSRDRNNDFTFVQNGTKVCSTGASDHGIGGRIDGATEHLHHHHHHHHHHHYVHHNLGLEASRLHKEAMTHVRAEQKLASLAV